MVNKPHKRLKQILQNRKLKMVSDGQKPLNLIVISEENKKLLLEIWFFYLSKILKHLGSD